MFKSVDHPLTKLGHKNCLPSMDLAPQAKIQNNVRFRSLNREPLFKNDSEEEENIYNTIDKTPIRNHF